MEGGSGGSTPASPKERGTRGRIGRTAAVLFGLLISVACTYRFVSRLDIDLPALETVDYRLVALAGIIYLMEFVFRALRWSVLLNPIKKIDLVPVLSVTFIGFTANALLPARAGELIKPWVGARRFSIPFTSVFVTTVMERIFDLAGLLSLLVIMTLTLPPAGQSGPSSSFLEWLQGGGRLLGSLGVVGMLTLFLLASREQWTRGLVERITCHLPGLLARISRKLYDGLAEGLASFHSYRGPLVATLLSVILWANGALAIWVMMLALDYELPFAGACFVSLTLAVAAFVPQGPGFIGVWQVAVSEALMSWGVPSVTAQAFSVIFWLLNFVPATVIGLLALWAQGLSIRNLWRLSDAPEPSSAPSSVPSSDPPFRENST